MEIGVQTKGIIEPGVDIEKGFQMIRDAGFTKVDFNLDVFLQNKDIYKGKLNAFFDAEPEQLIEYFEKYRKAMDAVGITPSQMHAPYPVRVPGNEEISAYMECSVIPKSIIIAQVLGAPWVVVHPFKMQYSHGKVEEYVQNREYFKTLAPLLRKTGTKVCFENLYEMIGDRIVEGVCAEPADAIFYVDRINREVGEELFGMCLDTGHLQLVKGDAYNYIAQMGDRIKVLHLHENDGAGDLHEMPYTFGCAGRTGFDWEGVAQGLAAVGFDGTLSYETFPCMNAFPYTAGSAVLKVIYEAGAYLAERVEYYSNGGELE